MKNSENIKIDISDLSSMKVVDLKTLAKKMKISNFSKLRKSELVSLLSNNIKTKEITINTSKKVNEKDKNQIEQSNSKLITSLVKKISEQNWFLKRSEIDKIILKIEKRYAEESAEKNNLESLSKEKKEFYYLINEYKKKKKEYFRELDENKSKNGEIKKNLIDEIKSLIGSDQSINIIYKKFKEYQNKWHETGPAPRKDNNNLWETYKHHVERFYDFLHINRELRNIDYKHNYNEKIKIIEKAEKLSNYEDAIKAGKELNSLHILWKNDLGPVAPEHREILWKRFQKASKIIHSRRQDFQKNIDKIQISNLKSKDSILKKMEVLLEVLPTNHYDWQKTIKNFIKLREDFKKIGSINKNESKKSWNSFRDIGKKFNQHKNQFYKDQKLNQKKNLEKYKLLVKEVHEINGKDDWRNFINRMKSIQNDFNKIGFVPSKISKNVKRDFIKKTNFYFKRLKDGFDHLNKLEEKIYNKKVDAIGLIKLDDKETDNFYNYFIEHWNKIINEDEIGLHLKNKIVKVFIKKVSSLIKSKQTDENLIFNIEVNCISDDINELKFKGNYYKKNQDLLRTKINQLENNLEFFSKSSNKSPMLKEVTQKLNTLNDKSILLKYKIDKINTLIKKFENDNVKKSKQNEINEE